METMRQVWHDLFGEPFTWLFYCFFQPERFHEEFEPKKIPSRVLTAFRFILPLFCICYPLILLVRLILGVSGNLSFPSGGWTQLLLNAALASLPGIAIGLFSGIAGGLTFSIPLAIAAGIALGVTNLGTTLLAGVVLAIIGGCLLGITQGNKWGIRVGLGVGVIWAFVGFFSAQFTGVVAFGISFIGSYILGYYRLPLYLVSGPSWLKAVLASRKTPERVFDYLHSSSLYWDECIYLPLPGLRQTLQIAAAQDPEKTLEVLAFIATKRPHQILAIRTVTLTMALDLLKKSETLRAIAENHPAFARLMSSPEKTIESRWIAYLIPLYEASQSAEQYYQAESWQTRRTFLQIFQESLWHGKLAQGTTNSATGYELEQIAARWQKIAAYEQDSLEKVLVSEDKLPNPYTAGPPLEASHNLFVGRFDVMQRFREALQTASTSIYLLNGERRMGKSSVLRQLPGFLGQNYLSILSDLQGSILTNVGTFFNTIAQELATMMRDQNMAVNPLDATQIFALSEQNEALAYSVFVEWFDPVEKVLQDSNKRLLLMFDEYEKLEEAEQDGKIDLTLLLNWFTSFTQKYSQIILLFCGTQTPDELGKRWEATFEDAQEFKVSFLNPEDARQLILYPLPHFPGKEIYSEEVISSIIEQTGCHPFLIQAVCEALIEYLNTEIRYPAEVKDVDIAVKQVLAEWSDTYFRDLWERTDQNQRICLLALTRLIQGDLPAIQQQSHLDKETIRSALQALYKRDLIRQENSCYHLAAPIFAEWMERGSFSSITAGV